MKRGISITAASMPLGFQDQGRRGLRRFGVPHGGVMDLVSAKMANLLVGNYGNQVLLEYAYGGITLDFFEDLYLSVVGAGGINRSRLYVAGEQLTIPIVGDCTWGYIAVSRGFLTEEVFGSASSNARAGWGGDLGKGSLLEVDNYLHPQDFKMKKYPTLDWMKSNFCSEQVLRVASGGMFKPDEERLFLSKTWKVSNLIDRSGYRLEGKVIPHSLEIKSGPVVEGAIQMTPDGQAIVTMPDGPTVGGYPVIGYIHPEDVRVLAQRLPGAPVRFKAYDFNEL